VSSYKGHRRVSFHHPLALTLLEDNSYLYSFLKICHIVDRDDL
jgi:hypothetical protein